MNEARARSAQKHLHLGVIWGGRFLHEKLLTEARPVTVGPSKSATLTVIGNFADEQNVLLPPEYLTFASTDPSVTIDAFGRFIAKDNQRPPMTVAEALETPRRDTSLEKLASLKPAFAVASCAGSSCAIRSDPAPP